MKLIHGDMLTELDGVPKNIPIVSDPPYCIGFKYREHDDKDIGLYIRMLEKLKGRPLVLMHYPEDFMRWFVPMFGVPDEVLAWCYPSNLNRQFRLWGVWGLKVNFANHLQPCRNPTSVKVKNKMVRSYDWWEQPQVKNVSKEKLDHPCQVPVSMLERIINLISPVEVVCDPFMGVGTTGQAAINLGVDFIGIEKDEHYFRQAKKRLEVRSAN